MECVLTDKFLQLLCCPNCRQTLEMTVFDDHDQSAASSTVSDSHGVNSGILTCTCGVSYPIIDGVPRLLERGLAAFPQVAQGQSNHERETDAGVISSIAAQGRSNDDYDYIRRSFSKEWGIFDYDTDKTWGWTLEERKKIFLDDVGLSKSDLEGKTLLDAGCGNGTLTAAVGTFGAEVVGIDLNDRLGEANHLKSKQAGKYADNVHFVQGNLINPPFKSKTFDLIYSSGVIHHTPDSKETFKSLVPLTKEGGRLYVWVYGKRHIAVRVFFGIGRQLKKFMSLESLMRTCRLVSPFYKLGTELLNTLGISRFRKRTAREITLDLFDAWAPQYNHWHSEKEVQKWFYESGFTNVRISGRQKHGFGCYGDKI